MRRLEFERFVEPFLPPEEQQDEFGDDQEWSFHRKVFLGQDLKPSLYKGFFLSSPYTGAWAFTENSLFSRQAKVWVGHTNFRITHGDENTIERVEGVEGARTLSPYRFLFAVGQMFKQDEVKAALRAALCPPPAPRATASAEPDPLIRAASRFPCWIIVLLRDGRRDVIGGANPTEAESRLSSRSDVVEILRRSWDGKAATGVGE